jgi:hypothetical protein
MQVSQASSHRLEHLLILGLCSFALAGAFLLQLSGEGRLSLSVPFICAEIPLPDMCWSRRFIGISCPGCGLTRSFVATAHGRLFEAMASNPMGPFLYGLCWCQVPYRLVEVSWIWRNSRIWGRVNRWADGITWILGGGLIIAWLARLF